MRIRRAAMAAAAFAIPAASVGVAPAWLADTDLSPSSFPDVPIGSTTISLNEPDSPRGGVSLLERPPTGQPASPTNETPGQFTAGTPAPTTTVAPTTTAPAPTTNATPTSTDSAALLSGTPLSLIDLAVHPGRPTTTTAPPRDRFEERGFAALADLSYPWQQMLPEWTIKFSPGRSGVLGYTYTDRKEIEVFVRDNISDSLLAHVIAHELGHAVDLTLNSGDDRRSWQDARGIASSAWWPSSGATDFSVGAGDFAESFAAWQVGATHYRSNLGSPPNADQFQLMSQLANNY